MAEETLPDVMIAYLGQIGIDENTDVDKVRKLHKMCSALLEEEIGALFVTDCIDGEDKRHYGSLWFFSKSWAVEAQGFLTNEDLDCLFVRSRVVTCHVVQQKGAGRKIRVSVEFAEGAKRELTAVKNNCAYLRSVLSTHLLPDRAA